MGFFSSIAIDVDNVKQHLRNREIVLVSTTSESNMECQFSLWECDNHKQELTKEEAIAILKDDYKSPAWQTAINKITIQPEKTTGYIPVYTKK